MIHELVHQWWGLGNMFDTVRSHSPWSAEGLTCLHHLPHRQGAVRRDYAQEHYVDQWQAVDDYYLNFYVRHPEYLEMLPEKEQLAISNSLSQVRQYCEMPLKILKAEQLVGGEEAMDQILHDLFNRELDPMYPLSDLPGIFGCLRADGGGFEPWVRFFDMSAAGCCGTSFFIGLAVVLLFYGALVLHAVTILGWSTPPLSPPGALGIISPRMLPLLWIGMLFFLTFYTSPPRPGGRRSSWMLRRCRKQYALARCAAALTGGVLLSLLCMGEAAVFYGRMFHWYSWGSLLLPAWVTLLPPWYYLLGQRLA